MGQYTLVVDPNSINKAQVQAFVDKYNALPGSAAFLNLTNKEGAGSIYISDNKQSELFSSGNVQRMLDIDATPNKTLNGYVQQVGGPDAIYLNFASAKQPENILTHEIGHIKWPGYGNDDTGHDPVFYKLLSDSLTTMGLSVNKNVDLNGIDVSTVPSPVPAGVSPLEYNIQRSKSDAGDDALGADTTGGTTPNWVVVTSADGSTVTESLLSPDGSSNLGKIKYETPAPGDVLKVTADSNGDGLWDNEKDFKVGGGVRATQFDPLNTQPWETHTIATDASGKVTADNYDYNSAANWETSHSLSAQELKAFNETSATELVATLERDAISGDVIGAGPASPFSLDPFFTEAPGGNIHEFDEGSYRINVGANDNLTTTPPTTITLVDNDGSTATGVDLSGLDNQYQGWTSDTTTGFQTYNYDDWSYGDNFGPIVLDLNGNGIDITPRTSSNAFFDVDVDGYYERTAWVGPTDGLLVLDLAANFAFDANGNMTAASYIGDGQINSQYEVAFWTADPINLDTDFKVAKALFDTNGNNQLDAGDSHWSSFRVWKDTNQDGISDAGEVVTLSSLGITSIGLTSDKQETLLPDGSVIHGYSTFSRTVGGVTTTSAAADVGFSYDLNGYYILNDIPGVGYTEYGEDGSVSRYQDAIYTPYYATNAWTYNVDDTWAGALAGQLNDVIIATGVRGKTLFGDAGNDTITGGAGADIIDGGAGIDVINGGAGDDTIYFDTAEAANVNGGTGYDTGILASYATAGVGISIDLNARSLEGFVSGDRNDTINGSALAVGATIDGRAGDDTITGSAFGDMLTGGSGNDIVNAGAGADLVLGGAGNDTLNGQDGDDHLFGGDGADVITGGLGSDILDGGIGNDSMAGGVGDDTYIIDSYSDAATELANEGIDTVNTSVSYTIAANIENVNLTSNANDGVQGNALANVINGNAGNNGIAAGDGNDTINAGAGNDVLDGGLGADVMAGGTGADVYFVDNLGDTIVGETAEAGVYDTVWTTVNFTLSAEVEILILNGGNLNINGTGNAGASGINPNLMLGNNGANALTTFGGNDIILGLDGNDTINAGGSSGAGYNLIVGGNGADVMTAGSGHDFFGFSSIGEAGDTINGFTTAGGAALDILDMRTMFTTFTNWAGGSSASAVADGHLTFTQSGANTLVYADANGGAHGAGEQIFLATLVGTTSAAVQNNTLV
jgi:Ca2+-binding RTX toxin-like protein